MVQQTPNEPGQGSSRRLLPQGLIWVAAIILVLGAAFLIWQTQFRQPSGPLQPVPDQASLTLVDQITDNLKVLVQGAALTQDGFLVVHQDQDGSPGKIIGSSRFLPAGFYEDVLISVKSLDFGKNKLQVMIHTDNGDQEFEPAVDLPFVQDGAIVVEPVEVDFQPKLPGGKG